MEEVEEQIQIQRWSCRWVLIFEIWTLNRLHSSWWIMNVSWLMWYDHWSELLAKNGSIIIYDSWSMANAHTSSLTFTVSGALWMSISLNLWMWDKSRLSAEQEQIVATRIQVMCQGSRPQGLGWARWDLSRICSHRMSSELYECKRENCVRKPSAVYT